MSVGMTRRVDMVLALVLLMCVCMNVVHATWTPPDYPMSTCSTTRITYYTYNNNGACGFGPLGGPTLPTVYFAAPNQAFYGDGSKCGVCYELTGPSGTQIVMVADECPVSGNLACDGTVDHFDLGPDSSTFNQIASPAWGMAMVTKREVACPWTGNVGVQTYTGISQYYMAILVFNHRVGVQSVQIQPQGTTWYAMVRTTYNIWTFNPPSGVTVQAPFNVQITSILNDVITISITSLTASQIYTSTAQFSYPPAGFGNSTSGSTHCPVQPDSPIVYQDALYTAPAPSSSWQDISFGVDSTLNSGKVNYAYTTNPASGNDCIQTRLTGYGGVQIYRAVNFTWSGEFTAISFYGRVDTNVTYSTLLFQIQGGGSKTITLTSSWQLFTFALDSTGLNAPALIGGSHALMWQNSQSTTGPTFYLDNIQFIPVATGTAAPTPKPPTPAPTTAPSVKPTSPPTPKPATPIPTQAPTSKSGTTAPTTAPSKAPTTAPSKAPTTAPSKAPTMAPTTAPTSAPPSGMAIYIDSFQNSWFDVSYGVIPSGTSVNYAYTTNPHNGVNCAEFQLTNYGALQLYHNNAFTWYGTYTKLTFWARTNVTSYTKFNVIIQGGSTLNAPLTSVWQQFSFSLGTGGFNLPTSGTIGGTNGKIQMQSNQASDSPLLFVDDVYLQ